MNIQPAYANFEQAKCFKEKGFDLPVFSYFRNENSVWNFYPMFEQSPDNWNANSYIDCYSRPEQWQVVEWLRVEKGIWVEVLTEKFLFIFQIKKIGKEGFIAGKFENTPQEAYSAAFDYIKDNKLI